MRRSRSFTQVDVFASEPLLGNPVAVVLDAEGLGTEDMQRFASWTNLSEATFLAPPTHPDADYRVRIFTGAGELPFAGHPTLGSCFAWLTAGGMPKGDLVVQECEAGLVPIRRDRLTGQLLFAAPPRLRSGPLDDSDVELIAGGLSLSRSEIVDHQWCDNGPPWQAVFLESAEQVLAVRPDPALLGGRMIGVVGPRPADGQAQFEVRAFFPANQDLGEDPVTGSLNAALGQWLIETGKAPRRYVVAQGTALGRAGRVSIEQAGDVVWVGGHCVQVLAGTATL
jgi:PhzF family phenazine biosynthesis protein